MMISEKINLKKIGIFIEAISILFVFIIIVFLYKWIHELLHLAVCNLSGNMGKVFFGLYPKVECPGIINSTVLVYWLTAMAPYIFLALPIVLIFAFISPSTKNLYTLIPLIIIPWVALLDSLTNLFYFLAPTNDFHNLLAVNPLLFAFGVLVVIIITLISTLWIKKHLILLRKAMSSKKGRSVNIEKVAFFVTILALIGTLITLQLTLYQIEYPVLNITHEIDEENGMLLVSIKNMAKFKETGIINFYRLEISDSKPHFQINSLKPEENKTLNFAINIEHINYSMPFQSGDYPLILKFTLPAHKLYFITEQTSISYKITCDYCYSQGFIRRIPNFSEIVSGFTVNYENISVKGSLPIYSWVTYDLEDL